MSAYPDSYETVEDVTSTGMEFFFVSEGRCHIIKAVQYIRVQALEGQTLFNLGFGDYDLKTGSIVDDQASNNGDPYKVFNTVLNTIPDFFSVFSKAVMIVWGSDSEHEFQKNCHNSCKKKCSPNECRNAHRRINIYRNYVNKNYELLTREYEFLGGRTTIENQLFTEPYAIGKDYNAVLMRKKT
jgi:hypothetical protein